MHAGAVKVRGAEGIELLGTVAEHVVRLAVGGGQERTFRVAHAVIAGWTGRDAGALQKHLRELQEIGVSPPSSTPIFYRVSANRLTTAPVIEAVGEQTSGEVEFVLIQSAGRLYVGVGSDHTDRAAEAYNVAMSKQMCDKPIAPAVWDFTDVAPHWDQLILRAWTGDQQRPILYQEGPVSAMLAPADLIERFAGGNGLPDGTAMFGGTLAAQGGIRPTPRFEFEIEDPVRQRRIRHAYHVVSLPMVA